MRSMSLAKAQRGISLLEVLISLLILSIGALGFAALQLKGLDTTEDANYRAHATLIAQDAIERILSNPAQRNSYLTSWPTITGGNQPPNRAKCITNVCSASEMATWDKEQLAWTAANSLPAGRVMAADCTFNNNVQCVTVSWDGMAPASCSTASGINSASDSTCLVLEIIR